MSAPRCGRSVRWGMRVAERQRNGEGFLSLFCSREVEKYKTISANFLYQMNARMEFLRTTTAVKLEDGPGASGTAIQGGVSRRIKAGDVVIIPAGVPHWFIQIEGSITYLVVRVDPSPVLDVK